MLEREVLGRVQLPSGTTRLTDTEQTAERHMHAREYEAMEEMLYGSGDCRFARLFDRRLRFAGRLPIGDQERRLGS